MKLKTGSNISGYKPQQWLPNKKNVQIYEKACIILRAFLGYFLVCCHGITWWERPCSPDVRAFADFEVFSLLNRTHFPFSSVLSIAQAQLFLKAFEYY
jgi:hypothetical protein